MARFEVLNPGELIAQLNKLGNAETVIPATLSAAAQPLQKSIRRRAMQHDRSEPVQHMSDAVKIQKPKQNKNGDWICKIGFVGYDKSRKPTPGYPKGVPQPIKAAGIEYGNAHEAARPFLDAAFKDAEAEVLDEMRAEFNRGVGI